MATTPSISGRMQYSNPLAFTAIRRASTTPTTTLYFLSAETTLQHTLTVNVQTALLEAGVAFSVPETDQLPQPLQVLYWSEAVPRSDAPILMSAKTDSGSLMQTETESGLTAVSTIQPESTPSGDWRRSAITRAGFIEVRAVTTSEVSLNLTVAASPAAAQPPFRSFGTVSDGDYTDVALYTSGPFAAASTTSTNLVTITGSLPTRSECYCIQFDGTITFVSDGGPSPPGTGAMVLHRTTAPVQTGVAQASGWGSVLSLTMGDVANAGTPHAVVRTNNGETVLIVSGSSSSPPPLYFYVADAGLLSYALANQFVMIAFDRFQNGVILAWGPSKLVMFNNAYSSGSAYSLYTVIDCDVPTVLSPSSTNITADLLVYAGTSPAQDVLFVVASHFDSISGETAITPYSLSGSGPYSWTAVGVTWTPIPADVQGGVVDLRADIDLATNTTLIVAVATDVWYYTLDLAA